VQVCELILNNAEATEDKNPLSNLGGNVNVSPLHLAASHGHLKVCKLILQHVQNKNPEARNGWTPLHSAAQMGAVS
jgi:ankyrin repeat protein